MILPRIFICLALLMTRAEAVERNIYVLAGDSNMLGLTDSTSYHAITMDKAIRFYPEVGFSSRRLPDMTVSEYPPATKGKNLARWLQTVPRDAHDLAPVPTAGTMRAGMEIQFGRTMHSWKGAGHYTTIAKFAYGRSVLETHWMHSATVDLSNRLLMFLSQVQLSIAQGKDTSEVSGLVLFIGNNDIDDPANAPYFLESLQTLVGKVRSFVGKPNLPAVVIKIHILNQDSNPDYVSIRNDIETFAATDPCAGRVYVDDLQHLDDKHFVPYAYNTIGQRAFTSMAQVMMRPACTSVPASAAYAR